MAHLGNSQHPAKSPSSSQIQLCHSGCLTGNLKPYQGQVLQGGSLVTSSNGCYRDYFPRLFALSLLHCISACIFALPALSDCHPFCAPGTLTPTFDQQCQPSPFQHNAPTPLIWSRLPVNIHRTACKRAEKSKSLPPFKIFGATHRRCNCLTGCALTPAYPSE